MTRGRKELPAAYRDMHKRHSSAIKAAWAAKVGKYANRTEAGEAGFSYVALAEKLGCTRQAVSNKFNGGDPLNEDFLRLVCPMVGVDADSILTDLGEAAEDQLALPSPGTTSESQRKASAKYQEGIAEKVKSGEYARVNAVIRDPRHVDVWNRLMERNGSSVATLEFLLGQVELSDENYGEGHD